MTLEQIVDKVNKMPRKQRRVASKRFIRSKTVPFWTYIYRFIKGKMICRHFSMESVYCYDCLLYKCKYNARECHAYLNNKRRK